MSRATLDWSQEAVGSLAHPRSSNRCVRPRRGWRSKRRTLLRHKLLLQLLLLRPAGGCSPARPDTEAAPRATSPRFVRPERATCFALPSRVQVRSGAGSGELLSALVPTLRVPPLGLCSSGNACQAEVQQVKFPPSSVAASFW